MDLKDFVVGEVIAEGGLGEILAATQRATGRQVVIKRAKRRDEQTYERTRDEGRLGLRLNGTAFVETVGHFEQDGVPHVVLEFVEGVHIAELVRRTGALSCTAVAKLGAEIAGALAVLHALRDASDRPLNAIHRDISVRNVMVDLMGRVRVIDLGMAYTTSVDRSAATRQGVLVGTITYLPPEVFAGIDDTPARDVWSLGVLLLEAALGKQYARGRAGETTKERMARVKRKAEDPFSTPEVMSLDPRLLRVLKQMLQRNPVERMDARTAAAELSAIYAGTGSHPAEELAQRVRRARQLPASPPKPLPEGLALPPTPPASTVVISRTEPEAFNGDDETTVIEEMASCITPPQTPPLVVPTPPVPSDDFSDGDKTLAFADPDAATALALYAAGSGPRHAAATTMSVKVLALAFGAAFVLVLILVGTLT